MKKYGLLLSCVGVLLITFSTHLGVVSGFVGTVVWRGRSWQLADIAGWLLLMLGFFLQYMGEQRSPKSTSTAAELHTLLEVLEEKGILTQAEVLDQVKRLRGKCGAAR
jgi:hypothetical protein